MDKIKSRFNSFSGKITLIVMLGISLIAVTVSACYVEAGFYKKLRGFPGKGF